MAEALHKSNAMLVYGGSRVGLMGEIARTLVALSGPSSVLGIIPEPLKGLGQSHATSNSDEDAVYGHIRVVKDMHTRKQYMAREVIAGGPGSGFVTLSGGYGTLEELMEVNTWNQLGIHNMPVVLFNVDGYWDGLLGWIQNAVRSGFVKPGNVNIVSVGSSPEDVMDRLNDYQNARQRFGLTWEKL
jgi:uncharacterized protein (TIGR00730 family)